MGCGQRTRSLSKNSLLVRSCSGLSLSTRHCPSRHCSSRHCPSRHCSSRHSSAGLRLIAVLVLHQDYCPAYHIGMMPFYDAIRGSAHPLYYVAQKDIRANSAGRPRSENVPCRGLCSRNYRYDHLPHIVIHMQRK